MKKKHSVKSLLGIALLTPILLGCSHQNAKATPKSPVTSSEKTPLVAPKVPQVAPQKAEKTSGKVFETGIASYYSSYFHGRKTASGERIYNHSFAAAHKKLPFGTKVKVTALWNGKSTIVKIIDRGPYPKGRVIDLSQAAAKELNLIGRGVGKVTLEIVK